MMIMALTTCFAGWGGWFRFWGTIYWIAQGTQCTDRRRKPPERVNSGI